MDSSPFTNSRRVLTTPRFAVRSRWSASGKLPATRGDDPHAVVDKTTTARPIQTTRRTRLGRLPGRSERARRDVTSRVDGDHRSLACGSQDRGGSGVAFDHPTVGRPARDGRVEDTTALLR